MSVLRTVLREPFTARPWRETLYLALALPVAAGGFLLAVLVLPATLLFPIVVGPFAMAGLLHIARGYGGLHRGLAHRVLRVPFLAGPQPPPRFRRGAWPWLEWSLRQPGNWRSLLYGLVKFPLAAVSAYAVLFLWAWSIASFAYPLLRYLSREVRPDGTVHYGIGRWGHLDSWWWAAFWSLAGVVAFFATPWVARGLVRVDLFLHRHLLTGVSMAERVRDLERSRAHAVDDSAATLRRIERDLHDGAQARLVALAMNLTMVRETLAAAEPDLVRTRGLVDHAATHVREAIAELRDLARGIHPPVLDNGLGDALTTLAASSALPVRLKVFLPERPSAAIETIAYFCAAELVTNATRHGGAGHVWISVDQPNGRLRLRVTDDGRGGARPGGVGGRAGGAGTGLAGLVERVRAVDGNLGIDSPLGGPSVVTVDLPLRV